MKECRGAQAICALGRASLWVSAADVLHAKQCSTGKDANSLAGAVGIKAEVTLANVPRWLKPSLLNAASAE